MIHLDIYNKTSTSIPSKLLKALLPAAFQTLVREKICKPSAQFFVELTFIGDRAMIRLNKRHHHKNQPTDVISLSYFDKSSRGGVSHFFAGEIFISIPYARRQAKKIGQSLTEELQFLFIHGLLHVFGYDHKKPDEEAHMKQCTYRILGRI